MTFKIHPEFRDRIPSLSKDERDRLEANILKDGCREPLCLWYSDLDDETYLLDGHNRFEICNRLRIGFETVEIDDISSTDEALDWIDRNQIGKRNLSPDDFRIISGRIYNHRKKAANDGGKGTPKATVPQIDGQFTSAIVASELGVSKATIERNGQRAEVYDAMKSLGDDEAAEAAKTLPQAVVANVATVIKQTKKEAYLEACNDEAHRYRAAKLEAIEAEKKLQDRLLVAAELKAAKAVHVSQNTGVPEWYTPAVYIEAARRVLGVINTDPASSDIAQATVKAEAYYTISDNGLDQDWGGCVWLNPPYTAGLVDRFIEKLLRHIQDGSVIGAIVLVNNATETKWFQSLMSVSDAVCFPASRIRFLDPEGNPGAPLQGQSILYYGKDPELFCDSFRQFGCCVFTENCVLFETPDSKKGSVTRLKSIWKEADAIGRKAMQVWFDDNCRTTGALPCK